MARYKLDLVEVQEVRWDKVGTVKGGDYSFFYGKVAGGKIETNEMGRACSAYGGGQRCVKGVGGEA